MEETNLTLDKSTIFLDNATEDAKVFTEKNLPNKQKNGFKNKECRVIFYNKRNGVLDVEFDGYGIRIKNVKDFNGSTVEIKYKGEIGKPNFTYKL